MAAIFSPVDGMVRINGAGAAYAVPVTARAVPSVAAFTNVLRRQIVVEHCNELRSIWNNETSRCYVSTTNARFSIGVVNVQLGNIRRPIVVGPDCNWLIKAIAVKRARYQQLTAIVRRIEGHREIVGTFASPGDAQRVSG